MNDLHYDDFIKIDMRIGTIITAMEFPEARKPAYKLTIDFGELGIKRSSAQITDYYSCAELEGKQIVAVVNFPPKQIANFISECLVLGAIDAEGKVVLLEPQQPAANGLRIS
ncbi:MAG TPA: tRNA-binding protein [Bacteroidetes bacterium]|jgi:tRNA-binding protein|nr:MAG: tRNA-binding protein [Sphingobacteriales bacterium BACL12 MAG-120802-bin5]KRP13573.1 MAG: tRNA-binding protein [Sphingobacteriales bacterium BACL12 MAG-120813-bin55]HCK23002.1 tRNA-binding protein [Bacteroidota bacterium]